MNFGKNMVRAYFDLVYNRLYDFTTARLAPYRTLQRTCIDKLKFDDGDKVLCAGVGTGNEIICILKANSKVSIVGVDCSDTALKRAYKKALTWGKEIEVLTMDAQNLEFTTGSFDKVLCLHVMDFIEDKRKTTEEILRILRKGGQFVITYPSAKEGVNLGINLLKDSIRHNTNSGRCIRIFSGLLSILSGGLVYIPLIFRPGQKSYSRGELEAIFLELGVVNFQIEDYPVYHDLIVCGRK